MLDRAIAEKQDPVRRLALLGVYASYQHTNIEKFPSKPFNPLLGETYEQIIKGKYEFLAEQVSHHPPIAAYYCKGESGYLRYCTQRLGNRFAGTTIIFANMYKEYIELLPYKEKY